MDADKEKDSNKDKHPPVLEEDNKTQQSASLDVAVDEAQVAENKENRAIEKRKRKQNKQQNCPLKRLLLNFQRKKQLYKLKFVSIFSSCSSKSKTF